MKKLLLALLIAPIICFGQNSIKTTIYDCNKVNDCFSYATPSTAFLVVPETQLDLLSLSVVNNNQKVILNINSKTGEIKISASMNEIDDCIKTSFTYEQKYICILAKEVKVLRDKIDNINLELFNITETKK